MYFGVQFSSGSSPPWQRRQSPIPFHPHIGHRRRSCGKWLQNLQLFPLQWTDFQQNSTSEFPQPPKTAPADGDQALKHKPAGSSSCSKRCMWGSAHLVIRGTAAVTLELATEHFIRPLFLFWGKRPICPFFLLPSLTVSCYIIDLFVLYPFCLDADQLSTFSLVERWCSGSWITFKATVNSG